MPVHRYAVQQTRLSLPRIRQKTNFANPVERTLTMLDSFERTIAAVSGELAWLPENVLATALLILAILLALALHGTVRRLIARLLQDRSSYLLSLFASAEGLTRFALIILAASIVLPVLPFTPDAASIVARLLLLA